MREEKRWKQPTLQLCTPHRTTSENEGKKKKKIKRHKVKEMDFIKWNPVSLDYLG